MSGATATQTDTTEVHPPNPSNAAPEPDPEWDFGNGKRFKRSEALKKIAALEKGMHEGFRGRSEAQKKYDALSQALSKTGISVEKYLADPDRYFDQVAQDRIARQMDEAMMDPRERELTTKERELAEREAKQKAWEEQQQTQQREQRISERTQQIASDLAPAMEQAGLPRNPYWVHRMALVIGQEAKRGVRLDPSEVASYVREQYEQEQQQHLGQYTDAEALASYLGPERLESLRQLLVQRAKAQRTTQPQAQRPAPSTPRDQHSGRYIGWGDYAKTKRI